MAFAVAAAAVMRMTWVPVGDIAMMEMLARDVPDHLPLVGVYSRFGWSHPGPLQLWWLGGFLHVLGTSNAMMVGTLVLHLVAVLAAWWMARQIARIAGWTVLIALLAVLAAVTAQMGHSPWNPYVSMVGAGTLVVAAWATGERRPWAPVVLVAAASILVQAHVATVPFVALVSLTGVCVAEHTGRRTGGHAMSRRSFMTAASIGLLLWIGPLLDRFTSSRPNATLLQMGGDGAPVGVVHALSTLTRSFAILPSWLTVDGPGRPMADGSFAVPVWLIVPVAGFILAVVRRDRPFVRASVVVAAAMVATVVSASMIRGDYHNHLAVIDRPVAAIALGVGFASLARHLSTFATVTPMLRRSASAAAAATACGLSLIVCVRQVVGADVVDSDPALIQLADQVGGHFDVGDMLVLRAPGNPGNWDRLTPGLMLQLEMRGFDVRQLDAEPRTIGAHRVTRDADRGVNLAVIGEPDRDAYTTDGWRIIASSGRRTRILVAMRSPGR